MSDTTVNTENTDTDTSAILEEQPTTFSLPTVDLNEPEGRVSDVTHIMSDLWVGSMDHQLVEEEFDSVLTLAKEAGHIPDTMRHRHIPLGTHILDEAKVTKAVNWVYTQWKQDRSVLVRCDYDIDRAAMIVALVCIEMGGTGYDAMGALAGARVMLNDFRYRKFVYEAGATNAQEDDSLIPPI